MSEQLKKSMDWMKKGYFDDLIHFNPSENYFSQVWDLVLKEKVIFTKLLDVGCGTGIFTQYIQSKLPDLEIYGVDGSPHAIELASTTKIFKELELIVDFNTDSLPWNNSSFDFVVCKDLLEHLIAPQRLIKEINRVLRSNSYLLVHVPNHFSLYGRIRFLISNKIDTFDFFPNSKLWEFPHIRFYTLESLIELMNIEGFSYVKNISHLFTSFPAERYLPFGNKLTTKLAKAYPNQFAAAFTILFKKNH